MKKPLPSMSIRMRDRIWTARHQKQKLKSKRLPPAYLIRKLVCGGIINRVLFEEN